MADLPDDVARWLRTLKLSKEITSTKDFENGFYFGEIFNRLGLRRNRQYHNKNDLSCVFHNYKTTKELMQENFGVDVPVDNLIYKAKQILVLLRQNALKQEQARKQITVQGTLPPQQTEQYNTMKSQLTSQLGQTSSLPLPRKIQDIELKLQKYRDEKVKHELIALEQRKKEMLENQRAVFELRQHQRSQLRSNHEFVKTMDAKIYSEWMHTEKVKEERVQREKTFNEFMRSKKLAHMKSLRNQDEKDFRDGLETFEMNCLKLGIDLEKDLDTVLKEKDQPKKAFNKVAFLQRIRDKNDKEELARKQKVKRQNNTNIEQQIAAKKAEQVFSQQAIVERYAKASAGQAMTVSNYRIAQVKEEFEYQQRLAREEEQSKVEYTIEFDEQQQRQRQEEMRLKRIEYMQENYERKVRRRERHNGYMSGVIDSILELTEECYAEQKKAGSIQIPYKYWLGMMDKFVEGAPYNPRVSLHASPKVSKRLNSTLSKQEIENCEREFRVYSSQQSHWAPLAAQAADLRREAVAKPLELLIDTVYPAGQRPTKPDFPLYMPLKVSVVGSTLSGRKTQAQKLATKYGLIYIDPYQVIREALVLANPPPVDDKKAGKKQAKKPEQDKPEKAALKEFGVRIKDSIKLPEEANNELLLQAFTLKLKQNFQNKSAEAVLEEFKEAEKKEAEKYAQQLKDFQDNAKKKKDPKKPVEPEQPPKPAKFPYTKGFVLAGYPTDLDSTKQFDKVVGGLVQEEELVNQNAVKEKQANSVTVRFTERKVDLSLKEGPLDLVLLLEVPKEQLDARNQGRKLDPTTNQIYHMTLNPPPTDVKGLVERLVEVSPVNIVEANSSVIESYYAKRGIEQINFKALRKIAAADSIVNVSKLLDTPIDRILTLKTDKFREAIANSKPTATEQQNPAEEPAAELPAVSQAVAESLPVPETTKPAPIKPETAAKLLSMFKSIMNSYGTDMKDYLVRLAEYRSLFLDKMDQLQRNFLDIILRPDDKIRRIKTYQDTYNKLLEEKEGLLQIQQAKAHLLGKLDSLYDGLWQSICAKKNEGVQSRQNLIASTWIEGEAAAVLDTLEKIIQAEVNKSTEIIEFTICVVAAQHNLPFNSSNEHVLVATFLESEEMVANADLAARRFPRLEVLNKVIKKLLGTLAEWTRYRQNKEGLKELQEEEVKLISEVSKQETRKLQIKLEQITEQAASRLLQYRALYNLLINRMDDWIIYGIKRENDIAYSAIKDIKKAINQVKKSNFKESSNRDINDTYRLYTRLSKVHLPICWEEQSKSFPTVEQARMLVDDLKTLCNDQYIPYELLKQYLTRRISSKLFSEVLSTLNFDYIQQYFLQDSRINRYQLSTAIVLYRCKVPLEDDIEAYKQRLVANTNEGRLTLEQFIQVPSFFESEQPRARALCLKHLLFEVFRQDGHNELDVDNLIDTLSQLYRMQVETFSNLLHDRR